MSPNKFEINSEGLLMRLDLRKILIDLEIIRKPYIRCVGIGSMVDDGGFPIKHVLFLDYDNIDRKLLEMELERCAKKYRLTPFYLFATREYDGAGNYHAISLTKLSMKEAYEIMSQCHVDPDFCRVPKVMRYRFWVLRIMDKDGKTKPKFLKIVPEKDWILDREISSAHLKFLKFYYDVPDIPYKVLDNSKGVFMTTYMTASR